MLADLPRTATRQHNSRRIAVAAARLAAAALVLCPTFSFFSMDAPWLARGLVAAVLAAACLRPGAALLACAACLPLAAAPMAVWGSQPALTDPIVLAFLAGWLIHDALRARNGSDRDDWRCLAPAITLAGVVIASCVVQLALLQAVSDYPWPFLRQVYAFLTRSYFSPHTGLRAIPDAALLLEGLGLFAAGVVLGGRQPALRPRLIAAVTAGSVAMACLNLARLFVLAGRSADFFTGLRTNLLQNRISFAFPDFNAAASLMVMSILFAGGLAVTGRRRGRAWWAAVPVLLAGVWLTGSRVALFAAPFAAAVVLGVRALGRAGASRRRAIVVAGAAAVLLVAVVLPLKPANDNPERSIRASFKWRIGLGQAALAMAATRPVFGVGGGRFYALSPQFIPPDVKSVIPQENAHNYFLQVLAEYGAVGLAALAWLLAAVAHRLVKSGSAGGRTILASAAAAGVGAFLLTCLTGHPLLVREVAFPFWVALAATAGLGSDEPARQPPGASTSALRVLTLALVFLLAVSVPLRAAYEWSRADLSAAQAGFSNWRTGDDGIRFHWMGPQARIFVPAATRVAKLQLRIEQGTANVRVSIDDRVVADVRLEAPEWSDVVVQLPGPRSRGPRFLKVELKTDGLAPDARVQARQPILIPPAAPPR